MGDKDFRLSPTIRPERYQFRVAPDLTAGTFAADGHIDLILDEPTRTLTLHGVGLTVKHARISGAAATVTADADSQTLTFDTGAPLAAGPAKLEVAWSGAFQKDLRGLYLAGGIGVTQFEAADARRVFPCFDEPTFKARWELSVEAPADRMVLGNGPVVRDEPAGDGLRLRTLAPTPRMSSYLVALIVGDLAATEPTIVRNVPIRTWAVPAKAALARFAQECAAAALTRLEDYFEHPYVFGKLDQVGIPDFEAGAMENAGCVTFREIALLLDEEKAPLAMKKRVAEVITHELAHQWFGNLVTMSWWDDLWLNEAFATWMAYKIVDAWRPEWRMWDDFESGKAAALHLDALASSHPIHVEVRNAEQATENFDLITYEKGGAMLRMIEGYLGADAFRDGIRRYMKRHAWGNTVADDLWRALGEASGQPIEALANGWIGRSGYPLVEVARDGAQLRLSQRRFYADPKRFSAAGDETWQTWLVPVTMRYADDTGVREARLLLRGGEAEVTLEAQGAVRFVCANRGGAGFYRVKYTAEEIAALARHGDALAPVERVNLLADGWALFRAGAAPLAPLLDLLYAFGADEDYVVLGEVVGRLSGIEHRIAAEAARPAMRRLVEARFAPALGRLGWDPAPGEPDGRRLERAQVVRALALLARNRPAVDEARARLVKLLANPPGAPPPCDPNLLDAVSVAAARVADANVFDQLVERVAAEADPASKRRALVSLASVETEALVERAVALTLTETVPMQDVTTYVAGLLTNRAARDRAFDFVRAHWPEVHAKSAAPMLTRRMVEALGELTERRTEVEAFFAAHKDALAAVPQAVAQTRERLALDEEVQRRARPEVAAWLRAH
jgi:puromycin-sensitive aminopeptidase